MRYKVGDKVTIRRDLSSDMKNVVSEMVEFKGKRARIIDLEEDDIDPERIYYRINLDNKEWDWEDGMLEDKNHFTTADLKNGMKIVFRDNMIGWVLNCAIFDSFGSYVTHARRIQNDMRHITCKQRDIMEVYHGDELVYKREENENQEILDKISELEKQLAELKEMV